MPRADVRADKPVTGGGKADTESIREQWPAVLDAVRLERRVAWLLLSNATLDSLADGVLTLRFGKEGEARGFAISGYDRDLGQVVQAMFGIAPQIRAIAGPAPGPAAQGGSTPGPGAHGRGPQEPGPQRPGPPGAGSQGNGPPGPDPHGDGPQGRSPADSGRPVREAARGREAHAAAAGRRRADAGTPNARPPSGAARQSASFIAGDQPSGADIADMSDADALTGMDLVERELGGRIIEEIGEA